MGYDLSISVVDEQRPPYSIVECSLCSLISLLYLCNKLYKKLLPIWNYRLLQLKLHSYIVVVDVHTINYTLVYRLYDDDRVIRKLYHVDVGEI